MMNDAEACLKLFMTWKRRYKAEAGATLKQQVEGEVTKMETDFKTYKLDRDAMTTKRIQVQGGMEQLLTEGRVRDWEDAEDAQTQEAMNNVDRCESWKLGNWRLERTSRTTTECGDLVQ